MGMEHLLGNLLLENKGKEKFKFNHWTKLLRLNHLAQDHQSAPGRSA